MKKPPIGLKPKFIHDEERIIEVINAIFRYLEAVMKIPTEWIDEYNLCIEILHTENLLSEMLNKNREALTYPNVKMKTSEDIARIFTDNSLSALNKLLSEDYKNGYYEGIKHYVGHLKEMMNNID